MSVCFATVSALACFLSHLSFYSLKPPINYSSFYFGHYLLFISFLPSLLFSPYSFSSNLQCAFLPFDCSSKLQCAFLPFACSPMLKCYCQSALSARPICASFPCLASVAELAGIARSARMLGLGLGSWQCFIPCNTPQCFSTLESYTVLPILLNISRVQ